MGPRSLLRTRLRCRGRAAILVVFVTFGVVCHARLPRPSDVSEVKSCETEFAICQALFGTVGGKEANAVVRIVAIAPSSDSSGAQSP